MSVNIHFNKVGSGPNVVLIHGLFGMGSNLGALARSLQEKYRVFSVDLPNHGRSGSLPGADIPAMARQLIAWMDQQGLLSASLVGHSLGGKVAMEMALHNPLRVDCLAVADIAPVEYPPHHRNEFAALEAVSAAQCQSRAEAAEIMSGFLQDDGVVQFLLKNLARTPAGSYGWRFNLAEIVSSYPAIRAAVTSDTVFSGRVLFIKGGDSDYIQEEHRDCILSLFPSATLKVIPGCGHWLHAEQPRLFNNLVSRFLSG